MNPVSPIDEDEARPTTGNDEEVRNGRERTGDVEPSDDDAEDEREEIGARSGGVPICRP